MFTPRRVRRCPRCVQTPMECCTYENHRLEICPRCAGLWCTPSSWDVQKLGPFPAIDAEHHDAESVRTALFGPGASGPEITPAVGRACPTCRTPLNAIRVGGDEGCELDQCFSCGGIWLDKGEWEHLHTLHAWAREQEKIARPTTWGQWCFQFFLGLPVEFNLPPRRLPVVTFGLIALCVLIYIVQVANGEAAWEPFAMHPMRIWSGVGLYTLLTSVFMHAGVLHLLGNMYFLYVLGDNVEDALGRPAFLAFYLVCGVLSGLLHAAVFPTSDIPLVGASGAVCGVMAAYLLLYPRARLTFMLIVWQFKLSVVWWMVIYFGIQAAAAAITRGSEGVGIAYFAHIGGFLTGIVLILPFRHLIIERSPWLRVLHTWKERPPAKPAV